MSIYKGQVKVLRQEKIAAGIFSLWLKSPEIVKICNAGQFVSLYTDDKSRLLPRPISICEIDQDQESFRLVYRVTGPGTGTEQFSKLGQGDMVEVMGPLGNGFPLEGSNEAILIGGGIGVPPMLELSKQLNCEKKIVLGYKDEVFLTEELKKQGEIHIATEDGSSGIKGNVLDVIAGNNLSAEIIYACGPTPMLRAVKEYAEKKKIRCYLSMEERMACGIGACLACVCNTKEKDNHSNVNNRRVCKDGPVFLSSEVEL